MTNKKKLIVAVIATCSIITIFLISNIGSKEKDSALFTSVQKGEFEINVFTTGELEAKNSTRIDGPEGLRGVGIWQVKISDIIPEGTEVQKGDYIAALDKTEIANKLRDADSELQKIESQYSQTKLDTTLQLRQSRDELVNLEFAMKEKEIVLEQSAFEPPATIRQAQLDLERSKRAYEQAQTNYLIKEKQAKAKMQEVSASLAIAQNKLSMLQDLIKQFTILAPEPGMVIYQREWNGKKRAVGSTIGAWDPTVATLPDLSVMISKTYVNEVDIRKIKSKQKVLINLDAFPEKKLSGIVTEVANVGEQNPKTDAKVFEVKIIVNEKDTSLRPAMTTGNNIVVNKLKDVLFIPLETIHTQGDSITFVYVKEGLSFSKKQVLIGETNDNFAVVKEGLKEGEKLYLSTPSGVKDQQVILLSGKK